MPIDLHKPIVKATPDPAFTWLRRAAARCKSLLETVRSDLAAFRSRPELTFDPAGIGGWLLVPALSTYLLPVLSMNDLLAVVDQAQRHAAAGPAMLGRIEITACALLILFSLTLIRSFQARSKRYPLLFVTLLSMQVLVTLVQVNVAIHVSHQPWSTIDLTPITMRLCFCWALSFYLLLSRRVRHTFVR